MRERLIGPDSDDSGQSLAEYALLIGAVATLVISAALLFGPFLGEALRRVGAHLEEQVERLTSSAAPAPPGNGSGAGSAAGWTVVVPAPGHGPGAG